MVCMSRYHPRAFTNNLHENLAFEYHAQHSLTREQMFMLMVTAVTTITNMNFLKKFSVDAVTIRA